MSTIVLQRVTLGELLAPPAASAPPESESESDGRRSADFPVARVVLSRPEVRNAFNSRLISRLTDVMGELSTDPTVRVVVLAGDGPVFSAGADLNWMREAADYDRDANFADALALSNLLAAIRDCPRPVLCRVQGAAIGGGAGLVAAADIAVAAHDTRFAFSEVKVGLVPAVIAPFVVPRIGLAAARELFLTGETFDAERALGIGLVSRVAEAGKLDEAVAERAAALLLGGPEAQGVAKDLIRAVVERPEEARTLTAEAIAERRASAEGREGMTAFLEHREPSWRLPPRAQPDDGKTDR